MAFSDIPSRRNGNRITYGWFDILRDEGVALTTEVGTKAASADLEALSLTVTGHDAEITTLQSDLTALDNAKEDALGNPVGDGYVLSSTAAGVRTWVELPSGGGGGGGSLQWVEDVDAPLSSVENSQQVFKFTSGLGQKLYALVRVPSSYTAGKQVKMRLSHYTPDTAGTALIQSVSTLVRSGTDAMSSATNQRTSSNAAATVPATADVPQAVELDLTDAAGAVNGVGVSAGDFLKVYITRGTDTAASDLRVPVYGAEVTFNG